MKKVFLILFGLVVWTSAAVATEEGTETVACERTAWRHARNNVFGERETWPFTVRWGILKAGKAVLSVEGIDIIRGRPAYHLSMEMAAKGFVGKVHPYHDRTDSWLDRASLTTVLTRQSVRERHYGFDETIVMDPACRRFERKEQRSTENHLRQKQGRLLPEALDVYSTLFYLRTLPLAVGAAFPLTILANDASVAVTARVKKKEAVQVGSGKFECFRIELTTTDASAGEKIKDLQWWVSADEKHFPVRLRMEIGIGHIVADLAKPTELEAPDN